MKRNITALLLLMATGLFATGPSNMGLRIHPVSISHEGDVLARAYFYSNPMGAQMQMPISYSWVVFKKDGTIFQYLIHTVDTTDGREWPVIQRELDLWSNEFQKPADFSNPDPRLKDVLLRHPVFFENNTQQFAVNQEYSSEDFYTAHPNLRGTKQRTLDAHSSVEDFQNIKVLYDFPHFFLTENFQGYEDKVGAAFDYSSSFSDLDEYLAFEVYIIHAVLLKCTK
jgi:hypothetical protein